MKVFFGFITKKKANYLLFLFVTVSASIIFYTLPYFYKVFTDQLLASDIGSLYKTLFLLIGLRVLVMALKNISFFLGDKNAIDGGISARKEIFKKVQDLDFTFHSNKSTGYLISAFKRGDGAFWTLYFNIHHRFMDVLVGVFVMVYFLTKLAPVFSLVIIISFILSLFLSKILLSKNIAARKVHNEDEDVISGIIVDNMVNFETVKLFSKEDWEQKRLSDQFIPWKNSVMRYVNSFRAIDLTIGSLINISIFTSLYFALSLIQTETIGISDFVLVFGFINGFYPRLFDLIYGLRDVGKDFADIDRYFGLLDYKIEVKDPVSPVFVDALRGEVEFKGVSFTYSEGKKEAVKDVNLAIRQGQSIALVGRSGSGKTTLMKLLMRFYDSDEGQIMLDGTDIRHFTKSHLRSFMGVVPQEPVLFNNTIGYNISYGKPGASKEEVVAAAKIANLHDFIESIPKKYLTHVGERGIKLSGGQKQRLAIARMVLSNPDIIIFDEATSQLDSENEALIQEALWKVVKNKTTIIIAHRLSTAMRADKIVVMEKGKIVESGSHLSLLSKKKGLYKHFWDLQIKKSF